MTQEAAFIQAILDAPDQPANRLVYADWLEERGEGERAELIRCQLEWEEEAVGPEPMLDDWHWATCRKRVGDGGDWGTGRSWWLTVERDLPVMSGVGDEYSSRAGGCHVVSII